MTQAHGDAGMTKTNHTKMEQKKFDTDLREALTRMQPTLPEGMTERFMARLSQERPSIQEPPSPIWLKLRRITMWASTAVAVAAPALFYLLPPTAPAPMPEKKKTAQALASTAKPAAVATLKSAAPETAAGKAAPHATKRRGIVPVDAAGTLPATGDEETSTTTPAVLDPNTAVTEAPLHAQAEAAEHAPAEKAFADLAFTPQELILMERAKRMKVQATLYADEARQEALIASRERKTAFTIKNDSKDEKTITKNT